MSYVGAPAATDAPACDARRVLTAIAPRLRVRSGDVDGLLALIGDRSSERSGTAVLLTGGPGVGKSTTADALLQGLAPTMRRAFRVTADDSARRRPFGLIAALAGLVPEYPPRSDLGDRVLAAVEELCDSGPLVLCAEDLHHADGDSLRLLGQLVDATGDLPLTLVLSRRPLPARDQLTAIAVRPDVLDVEVIPLDRDGLNGLVRQRWGVRPDPALLDLLGVTGGNPFHAVAMLDELQRSDRLSMTGGTARLAAPGVPRSRPPSSPPSARSWPCSPSRPEICCRCWPSGAAPPMWPIWPRWPAARRCRCCARCSRRSTAAWPGGRPTTSSASRTTSIRRCCWTIWRRDCAGSCRRLCPTAVVDRRAAD